MWVKTVMVVITVITSFFMFACSGNPDHGLKLDYAKLIGKNSDKCEEVGNDTQCTVKGGQTASISGVWQLIGAGDAAITKLNCNLNIEGLGLIGKAFECKKDKTSPSPCGAQTQPSMTLSIVGALNMNIPQNRAREREQ